MRISTSTEFLNNVPGPPSEEERALPVGRFESLTENVSNISRIAPTHDWVSLSILIWMMANVGWSVQLAGWGDLPSIIPTLLLGTIAAFII